MTVIARYDASYAGVDAYGASPYGEVYVTPTEAMDALRQTSQYMTVLANDYLTWANMAVARGAITQGEASLLNGWRSFMGAWASFYASVEEIVSGYLSAQQQALNAREWRDQANNYLEQAKTWRANLAATGYKPNAPSNPSPSGGPLFNWPSLGDVPWWVWALGAGAVALWLGLPQMAVAALRGRSTRALAKGA